MASPEFMSHYDRGREIIKSSPHTYVDMHIESDGIPGCGSILTLGAVTQNGDKFYSELQPEGYEYVQRRSNFCTEQGISRRVLRETGEYPMDFIRKFYDWIKVVKEGDTKRLVNIVSFDAGFDYPLLAVKFESHNMTPTFQAANYSIRGLAAAIRTASGIWDDDSNRLRLPDDCKPEGNLTHHALQDAMFQQKIHYALIGKLASGTKATYDLPADTDIELVYELPNKIFGPTIEPGSMRDRRLSDTHYE